jgi:hypothetical protein
MRTIIIRVFNLMLLALGLSAAARVAARLDWNVIATQAADFIEQQAGLPKSSCQAAGPV